MPRSRLVAFALIAWVAFAAPAWAVNLLMITTNNGSLNSGETARKSMFESLGHTVTTLWDDSNQSQYNAAVALVEAVYVPVTVDHWQVGVKLRLATVGVLSEERYNDSDMGFAGSGWDTNYRDIVILDNDHEITQGFDEGTLRIVSSNQPLAIMNSPYAAGMEILAGQEWDRKMLGAIETGGALVNNINGNNVAAGRRVRLPWGGESFNINALNNNGKKLLNQAIVWAAGGGPIVEEELGYWRLDESSGKDAADSSGAGNDGTLAGKTEWIDPAVIRGGLDLLNSSASVRIDGLLDKPKNISLAGWAKLAVTDKSGAELVSVGDYAAIRLDEGSVTKGVIYDGDGYVSAAVNQTFAGAGWHHFAMTFDDKANVLKFYIDGALVASQAATRSIPYSGKGSHTFLGKHGDGSNAYTFNGGLDEVHAYNFPLTEKQVAALYGFIGYWRLNETAGTLAVDSTIFKSDGTVFGRPSWSTRCNGVSVFDFNGSSNYISIPNAPHLELKDSVTMAAWIKGDSWGSGSSVNAILRKGDNDPASYQLAVADGRAALFLDDSDAVGIRGRTVLNAGEWYHVAATWDGRQAKIYVNGVLDNVPATRNGELKKDSRPLFIGGRSGADQFDGMIYDVRLYNRELPQAEIAEMSGLSGHWKLDETSGITAADATGNGLTGTLVGTAAWGPGKIGGAVDLNGSTKVEIPSTFDAPKNVSFAAWANLDNRDNGGSEVLSIGDYFALRLDDTSSTSYAFYYNGADWTILKFNGTFAGKGWHHFAVVYDDDAKTFKVYVDGIERATMNTSKPIVWTGLGTKMAIGRHGNEQTNFDFDGRIDDVRVYTRVLCPEEIETVLGDSGFGGVRILKWQETQ